VSDDRSGLLLGVDLGTTALKCGLRRADGTLVASATREYQLSTPAPAIVEVPVATYWSAFLSALGSLLDQGGVDAARVDSIGISAQGETFVAVGADGVPLRDAIVWLDGRAVDEAEELDDRFGQKTIYEVTGQPSMMPTWPAAKILWLARHEPAVVERARRFLLLEDYFIARLTGEEVCEGSLVTSTCYWDFRRKRWWPEMLDTIGIGEDQLPSLVEPGTAVGRLRPAVAAELGLADATIVCSGALDQACGAIGVGNVHPGVFSENTGAAVALCATVEAPLLDPQLRMPCHYHGIPDTYMLHTFTTGGMALRWFRDEFCEEEAAVARRSGIDAYQLIDGEAQTVPPGAEGLVFLPHLQGAMAPESNANARGVLFGLSLHHGRAHVARAILEAIAVVVRRNVEVVEEIGIGISSIRSLGGGARSALWKQIEADVTKRPVLTTRDPDAATLGACILAGIATGLYSNVMEAAEAMVGVARTYEPDPRTASLYDEVYETHRALYEALCPLFGAGGGDDRTADR
jgi:sugar (pentulose or hexulose) kinase